MGNTFLVRCRDSHHRSSRLPILHFREQLAAVSLGAQLVLARLGLPLVTGPVSALLVRCWVVSGLPADARRRLSVAHVLSR